MVIARELKNILADVKGSKVKLNCSNADVRGDILRPPYGTTPVATIANKIINFTSHQSGESTVRYRKMCRVWLTR